MNVSAHYPFGLFRVTQSGRSHIRDFPEHAPDGVIPEAPPIIARSVPHTFQEEVGFLYIGLDLYQNGIKDVLLRIFFVYFKSQIC